ncbi:preprotein translocase subunit SecG [Arenicella xantha]|uniref:Protein-export membrane protein SecG n=1 Tax=Arenicella xantha TaxID=644221 RepID=A0A395JRY4_9GAMM|nr:preprotein translocase subunit SecG [Arenicella xantha]RBP51460.1 protein translocase subunit secG [Arenicella xantha]
MNVTTILIIVSVFAAITIIALVLMQNSKSDMGSAFGGGGSQSMFGSRGSANFLTKSTSAMVTVLFLSCLTLAYIYAKRNADADVIAPIVIEQVGEVPSIEVEADDAAATDAVPTLPEAVDSAVSEDVVESAAEQTPDATE